MFMFKIDIAIIITADLKKSMWHNITSVCKEGEEEDKAGVLF